MEIAPVRQPRVSPASPRTGRAWRTAAGLVGAALIAGVVMLPPFAAGYLFPSRDVAPASAPQSQPAAPSARQVRAPAADIDTADRGVRDQPQGDVDTVFRDLPIAAEPPNEPPHRDASVVPSNPLVPGSPPSGAPPSASPLTGMAPGSALATGLFAARPSGAPGGAAEPATELALPPIAPLATPAAAEPALSPAVSPPPRPREPLPLQTELLTSGTPAPPPSAGPDPMPAGSAPPAGSPGGHDRPTGRAADRHG
jgi:hypothetical protein